MEKIREIDLRTKGYSFTVEVFKDEDKGGFVATINGATPPLAQEISPGEGITYMEPIDEIQLKDADEENLVERCRQRIKEIGGEILMERERNN
jgi:hypothetical protein